MPSEDDLKTGHKYPFNACEILSSENNFIIDKLFESIKVDYEENERKQSDMSDLYKDDHSDSESSDRSEENNVKMNDENESVVKEGENNDINNNIVIKKENDIDEGPDRVESNQNDEVKIVSVSITDLPESSSKKIHHKKTQGGTQDIFDDNSDIFNISQEDNVSITPENVEVKF
jgi:hypothetical protein